MRARMIRAVTAVAAGALVLAACGAPSGLGAGGPHDRGAEMRPDLLVVSSQPVAPGEEFEVTFPEETMRGVAWVLEEADRRSWNLRWFLSVASEDYEEGASTPGWYAWEDRDGRGWPDVGINGPGPDRFVVPDEAASGTYRLCMANSVDNICAEIEVSGG